MWCETLFHAGPLPSFFKVNGEFGLFESQLRIDHESKFTAPDGTVGQRGVSFFLFDIESLGAPEKDVSSEILFGKLSKSGSQSRSVSSENETQVKELCGECPSNLRMRT